MNRALPGARLRAYRLTILLALWPLIPAAGRLRAFEPLWAARYEDSASAGAQAIAVNRLGNTFVAGGMPWTGGTNLTAMYDRDGRLVWAARCTLPGLEWVATGLDRAGNSYVIGNSYDGVQGFLISDYVVVKYRPTREQVWLARYSHNPDTLHSLDCAMAGFVDSAGNVYVTGYSVDDSTGPDCATVKFDSSGVLQWVARWDGGEGLYVYDKGNAVTTDRQGNVCVAGRGGYGGILTLKYSPTGDLLWAVIDSSTDGADAVAVDRAGNVYSFGTGGTSTWDYHLVKNDSTGRKLWAASYDGGGQDVGYAMVLDDSAGIYVTGLSDGPGTYQWDICTVKWDSAGNRRWVMRYEPASIGEDLATDGTYVYTVGGGSREMHLVTCDAATGAILWAAPYRYPGTERNYATAVTIGPDGCAHATGYCQDSAGGDTDFLTLKYNASGTGAISEPGDNPETRLGIVPSPFAGRTSIRFQIRRAGRVRITALDVAGRTVATLFDADVPKGPGEVTWQAQDLAGGVYFARLETSDGSFGERVLLVR